MSGTTKHIGFQFYQAIEAEGEIHHIKIGHPQTDDIVLSDIIFTDPEEAITSIKENHWGYSEDTLKDLGGVVLVRVEHTILEHPFVASEPTEEQVSAE